MRNGNGDARSVGADKGGWSSDRILPSIGIFRGECPIICCAALLSINTTGYRPIWYVGEHAILEACKISYVLAGRGSLCSIVVVRNNAE